MRKTLRFAALRYVLITALLLLQWAVNAHACAELAQLTDTGRHSNAQTVKSCHHQLKQKNSAICYEHCSKPGKHSESATPQLVALGNPLIQRLSVPDVSYLTALYASPDWARAHSPPLIILQQRFRI